MRQQAPQVSPEQQRILSLEAQLLSQVIVWPEDAAVIVSLLEPHEYAVDRHRRVRVAVGRMVEAGQRVEEFGLQRELAADGMDMFDAARTITELLNDRRCEPLRIVREYAAEVREAALKRKLAAEWQAGAVDAAQGFTDLAPRITSIESLTAQIEGLGTDMAVDDLDAWTADRYVGEAPAVDWVVPDVIARGEAHLLAAPGDSGKGFLSLELGLQLASGVYRTGRRAPFGHAILPLAEPSSVVLLYAEDSEQAIHRRLVALDPDGETRAKAGKRFRALAMPSAGGAMSFLERGPGETFVLSSRWRRMLDQLARVELLGLVVVDPLSCFLSLDIDADSAVAQAAMGEMARASAELKCAFLVAHHMRKTLDERPSKGALPELPTHETVRASIRGTAALLNGVRMAYGIVPMPSRYAKAVLTKLGERGELDVGRVYWGAIVKANGRTDRRPRLYVRSDYGLLEDRTSDIAVGGRLEDALKALLSPGGARAEA